MKQTKRFVAVLAAAAMALSSVSAFAAQDWRASQVRVDLEPVADYNLTQGNSLGDWSFFETAGFWPVSKVERGKGYLVPGTTDTWIADAGITLDDYKYGDTSNTSYFKPMTKIYPTGRTYTYYPFVQDPNGIVISGNGSANDFAPAINILTNASDGLSEFVLNGVHATDDNTADAIVCYTIPEAGDYEISHRFINKGKGYVGGNGMVRRTIIKKGASTFESAENSVDQKFGNITVVGQAAPEATGSVKDTFAVGDKIYFRISCLKDSYGDSIFGNVKITKFDKLGNVEKIYNLNDVGMSQTDQWRYYNSGVNANETNPDMYDRLYVKPNHPTDYAFPDTTDGVNGSEKMTAATLYWSHVGGSPISFNRRDFNYPFIEWFYDETPNYNKYENGVRFVMQRSPSPVNKGIIAKEYSLILGWVAPKDGFYKVGYETARYDKNPGTSEDGEDTKITLTHLAAGSTSDTNVLDERYLPNSTTENATMEDGYPIVEMEAGDRIMYRVTCEDEYSGDRVVIMTPFIAEAEEMVSMYTIDGTTLQIASNYTDYAREMNTIKPMQFIYSVVDATGKMVAAYTTESFKLSETSDDGYDWSGQIENEYKLPAEGNYSVITYLWDGIGTMKPIHTKK